MEAPALGSIVVAARDGGVDDTVCVQSRADEPSDPGLPSPEESASRKEASWVASAPGDPSATGTCVDASVAAVESPWAWPSVCPVLGPRDEASVGLPTGSAETVSPQANVGAPAIMIVITKVEGEGFFKAHLCQANRGVPGLESSSSMSTRGPVSIAFKSPSPHASCFCLSGAYNRRANWLGWRRATFNNT